MNPRQVLRTFSLDADSIWLWSGIGLCFAIIAIGIMRLAGAFPQHFVSCTAPNPHHVVVYVNNQIVRCTKP